MSKEQNKNYGKSIRTKLLNVARKENVFNQTILTRYFQERLLYRISQTHYRGNFYLKGGALMYAYEKFAARPTLDIDFLGNNISNEGSSIIAAFREICSMPYEEDGVIFDTENYGNKEDVDDFSPSYYWQSESPTYNDEALTSILAEQKLDIVITHTSPSFCELLSKEGITKWTCNDKTLISDIQQEREVMNSLYETLKEQQQHVTHWCYGHFHQSWHSSIDGTLFKMLDIMEFYELK